MKTTKYGRVILAESKDKNILEFLFNHPHLICIQIRVIPVIQNHLCWKKLSIILGTLKKLCTLNCEKRLKGFPWSLTNCRESWSCNFCTLNVYFLWLFVKQELHSVSIQLFQALVHFTAQFVPSLAAQLAMCTFSFHYLGKIWRIHQVSAFVSWCLLTDTD